MLKKVIRLIIVSIIVSITITSNVFASDNKLFHYEPYSDWAKEIGYKYDVVFKEKPQRNALRWEITNILGNFVNDVREDSNNPVFNDIDKLSDKVKQRITTLASIGIINGYDDGTFKPFNDVTRAEFMALMHRSDLLSDTNSNVDIAKFIDINNHWAEREINIAVKSGIINGKSNKEFCPNDNITLEEVFIILDRLVNNGKISEDNVLAAIQDTFNVQKYSDKDKYMIEVIYDEINKVQNEMDIYKHTLTEYDYESIGETVTLKDVLIWRYYYDGGGAALEPYHIEKVLDDEFFETIVKNANRYDRKVEGGRDIGYYFGLDSDTVDYNRPVTVNEFLIPLYNYVTVDLNNVDISFSNFNQFSNEEKEAIKRMVYWEILPNSGYEFPGNKYMTKALLNYITVKLNNKEDIYIYSHYYSNKKEYCVDKDLSSLPSNYKDYPFIARPISNEAYEIPFRNQEHEISRTPVENYYKGRSLYTDVRKSSIKYFNTLLNVDYNTISNENFTSVIKDLYTFPQEQSDFEQYIQYVKDNKIKLSGIVESYLPIFYYDGGAQNYRLRVKINFKVISSDTNKNLVLGDLRYKNSYDVVGGIQGKDIIYDGNEFDMYIEMPFDSLPSFYNTKNVGISDIFNLVTTISRVNKGSIYTTN